MRRLNMLDASWLLVESPETAMQVAGLQIFRLPKNAPSDFMQKFVAYLRSFPVSTPPFNYRLARGAMAKRARARRADLAPALDRARQDQTAVGMPRHRGSGAHQGRRGTLRALHQGASLAARRHGRGAHHPVDAVRRPEFRGGAAAVVATGAQSTARRAHAGVAARADARAVRRAAERDPRAADHARRAQEEGRGGTGRAVHLAAVDPQHARHRAAARGDAEPRPRALQEARAAR